MPTCSHDDDEDSSFASEFDHSTDGFIDWEDTTTREEEEVVHSVLLATETTSPPPSHFHDADERR